MTYAKAIKKTVTQITIKAAKPTVLAMTEMTKGSRMPTTGCHADQFGTDSKKRSSRTFP